MDYDALEKRMDGRACELSDGGLADWSNTMDDGRKAIQSLRARVAELEQVDRANGEMRRGLDATLAALEAENGRLKQQHQGAHPSPCARHCEAPAFAAEIRRLKARTGNLAAEAVLLRRERDAAQQGRYETPGAP